MKRSNCDTWISLIFIWSTIADTHRLSHTPLICIYIGRHTANLKKWRLDLGIALKYWRLLWQDFSPDWLGLASKRQLYILLVFFHLLVPTSPCTPIAVMVLYICHKRYSNFSQFPQNFPKAMILRTAQCEPRGEVEENIKQAIIHTALLWAGHSTQSRSGGISSPVTTVRTSVFVTVWLASVSPHVCKDNRQALYFYMPK